MDTIRGLCALGIVAVHAGIATSALTLTGAGLYIARLGAGIALFFVVSGFLLYRPFVAAQVEGSTEPPARAFWLNRIVRVIPPYWVALSICVTVPYLAAAYRAVGDIPAHDLWRYYGFLQVYDADTAPLGFGHAWTLCVDVPFYVLLPVYAAWVRRLGAGPRRMHNELLVLGVIGGASAALRIVSHLGGWEYPLGVTFAGAALWITLGMGLAVISVCAPDGRLFTQARKHPSRWWVGALAVFLVLTRIGLPRTAGIPYTDFGYAAEHLGYALVSVLILLPVAALAEWRVFAILSVRPLEWLGQISYGFYLWHLPMMFVMIRLGVIDAFPSMPFLALFLTTSAAATVCGGLSNSLMEQPIRRLVRRRRQARSSRSQIALAEVPHG